MGTAMVTSFQKVSLISLKCECLNLYKIHNLNDNIKLLKCAIIRLIKIFLKSNFAILVLPMINIIWI